MQDDVALEGGMFTNYLALHWYYIMMGIIRKHKCLAKYSLRYVFSLFTGVRVLRIGSQWKLTSIVNRDAKVLRKLELIPDDAFVYPYQKEINGDAEEKSALECKETAKD